MAIVAALLSLASLGSASGVMAATPITVDDPAVVIQMNAGSTSIDVLANDTVAVDATITLVSDPMHGTVVIALDGRTVNYLPDAGYAGADSFDYTVTDVDLSTGTATVTLAINAPPDAVDDVVTVDEDGGATPIDVLAGDTDAESAVLTVIGSTNGAKGVVAISGGGSGLTYTPAASANGSDSFTYSISDGVGGSDSAVVHVTITPENDNPAATDDSVIVGENQASATAVDVLANDQDLDGDPITVTATTDGAKGTVTIDPGGIGVSYQPALAKTGSDSFTYTVSDGQGGSATATVSVTITLNHPPQARPDGLPTPFVVYLAAAPKAIPVLSNDSSAPDPAETLTIVSVTQGAHGVVAITGGGNGLTYAATGAATGVDVFTYTISDGHGGTSSTSVQVNVVRDTTPPQAAILSIQKTAIPGKSGLRVYVKWSLMETGSGLAGQPLQRRTGTGAWVTVALSSLTTRAISFGLPRGHTYTFRVRGTDKAGNVGVFASRQIRI